MSIEATLFEGNLLYWNIYEGQWIIRISNWFNQTNLNNKSRYLIIRTSVCANSDAGCPEVVRTLAGQAVGSRVRLPEQVDADAGRSDAAGHDLLSFRAGGTSVSLEGRVLQFVSGGCHAAAVSDAGCTQRVVVPALAGGRADGCRVPVRVGEVELDVADAARVDGVIERAGHAEHAGAVRGDQSGDIHCKNKLG